MSRWVGVLVVIGVAVVGFLAFSFFSPETAQAPAGNIVVTSPAPNATITSPVTIVGEAKGTYYFEASFPIEIRDQNGVVIGQSHAEAGSDWMTVDFVPFTAIVTFTSPGAGQSGVIRLKNDNPSGDPARDLYFDLPVTF